jgi:ADP-heptose:LPS heptosyltransferase
MSVKVDGSKNLVYPAPRLPMVGQYLVRKRYVASGLRAVDLACSLFARQALTPASNQGDKIRSIVFSQCGHFGDLIMTLPTLRWIRQNRPDLTIGLIVGSWAKPMLGGISALFDASYFADHFMLNRSNRSLKEKLAQHRQSWKAAAAQIRKDGYDAAVDCYPFIQNSIPLLYACGIPVRAGFTSGGFGPLLTHGSQWERSARSYVDYPRDLLRLLFSDRSLESAFQAYYPPQPPASDRPKRPYVVFQTGAGSPIREWPEDRWIQLGRELTRRGHLVVLAGAGPRETERAGRIAAALPPSEVQDLCDRLSWDEFVDLIAGASYVMCLDSSTSHVAAAFRIPSTVIMPGINEPKLFAPANDRASILKFKTPCAPCFRGGGCEHMACIRGVTIEDATTSVLKGLDLRRCSRRDGGLAGSR